MARGNPEKIAAHVAVWLMWFAGLTLLPFAAPLLVLLYPGAVFPMVDFAYAAGRVFRDYPEAAFAYLVIAAVVATVGPIRLERERNRGRGCLAEIREQSRRTLAPPE